MLPIAQRFPDDFTSSRPGTSSIRTQRELEEYYNQSGPSTSRMIPSGSRGLTIGGNRPPARPSLTDSSDEYEEPDPNVVLSSRALRVLAEVNVHPVPPSPPPPRVLPPSKETQSGEVRTQQQQQRDPSDVTKVDPAQPSGVQPEEVGASTTRSDSVSESPIQSTSTEPNSEKKVHFQLSDDSRLPDDLKTCDKNVSTHCQFPKVKFVQKK